jgi:hypothetical protein
MLIEQLKNYVSNKRTENWPDFVIKNGLKEFLQFPVLAFIYSKQEYQNFQFIGGSALRIIHNLPRLSEDLDFNLSSEDYHLLDLNKMASDLKDYFKKDFSINISYRVQDKEAPGPSRLYLKFPVLKELDLSEGSESDFLYVKIEPQVDNLSKIETEINPISKYGFNFIVKNYSLKYLMTGKISAILEREWFKGENNEIDIKGRDYYDLYWYLDKEIEPDFNILKEKFSINNMDELKEVLKDKIDKEVTSKKLLFDLENFFKDQAFIKSFCSNYKEIIKKYL